MISESSNQRTVEFYLSSLWSWLPEGRKRILKVFAWDGKHDWFHIRCLEDDKDHIMNEYLKAQSEMENELKEKDVLLDDGNLIPIVENDLIRTSRPRVAVPEQPDEPQEAASPERIRIERSNGQHRVEKRIERRTVGAYAF